MGIARYFELPAEQRAPSMTLAELDAEVPREPYRRPGGDARGNAQDRRRRKIWLLATFGDGEKCPCAHCGAELDYDTVTVDRIVPGHEGGRYVRGNIQPSCRPCANRQGADMTNNRLDAPMELR